MVTANDSTSGTRSRGHGFDSRMLQNVSRRWRENYWLKWTSILSCDGRLCGPSHARNDVRQDESNHNLYTLCKFITYFWQFKLLRLMISANYPTLGSMWTIGFDSSVSYLFIYLFILVNVYKIFLNYELF